MVDIFVGRRKASAQNESLLQDKYVGLSRSNILKGIKVVIALGIHLFPFRTEKLSPTTSMVLRKSGRVDSRRFRESESSVKKRG